ncbi:hypothetical protein C0991_002831, partial [Blastosporella zonata]
FDHPAFRNAEYDLVVLEPERFLPPPTTLTIHHPLISQVGAPQSQSPPPPHSPKTYIPASNHIHILQTSPSPSSPHLPPFKDFPRPRPRHSNTHNPNWSLNPLFVAYNAASKFKSYYHYHYHYHNNNNNNSLNSQRQNPESGHRLADSVHLLMRRTLDLIRVLEFSPVPEAGTPGREAVLQRREELLWIVDHMEGSEEETKKKKKKGEGGEMMIMEGLEDVDDVERVLREQAEGVWGSMKRWYLREENLRKEVRGW